jgi:uncharacterized membrane protein
MESLFDTIAGLPVHPLVVHFAVVLLPLAALGTIASIFLPKVRSRYFGLSLLGLVVGTAATFVAKESGEALSERVGLPQRHSDLGTYLFIAAIILTLLALLSYRQKRNQQGSVNLLGGLVAIVGIVVIGLSVITGHTGAEAVWKARLTPAAQTQTGSAAGTITLADVATHNSPTDCWSAIDGKVYDLTKWIDKHPGGSVVIKSLCGKDGSAGFNAQHDNQRRPADELANYLVGELKAP